MTFIWFIAFVIAFSNVSYIHTKLQRRDRHKSPRIESKILKKITEIWHHFQVHWFSSITYWVLVIMWKYLLIVAGNKWQSVSCLMLNLDFEPKTQMKYSEKWWTKLMPFQYNHLLVYQYQNKSINTIATNR